MKQLLLFIPVCIYIAAIYAYLSGVWMIFSVLILSLGVFSLILLETYSIGFNLEDPDEKLIKIYQTKGPDELKSILRPKLICVTVCNALCFILSFYPFAFMSSSFSKLFHLEEPYEGGVLVTLISIFYIGFTGLFLFIFIYDLFSDRIIVKIKNKISQEEIRRKEYEEAKLKREKLIDSIAPTDNITNIGETLFAVSSVNNKVLIGDQIYNLSDIISFSISDNSEQIFTPTTSVTKTNTGSMVGRAIVGGVISGGVGALIGGTTANKETVTEGGSSKISHDYTLHISMDNLAEPLISIHIGENTIEMEQAKALLNVIVKKNTSS